MTLRSSDPFAGISVHLSQQNFDQWHSHERKLPPDKKWFLH